MNELVFMHFTPAFWHLSVASEVKQENKSPLIQTSTGPCAAAMFAMHPSMSIRMCGYHDFYEEWFGPKESSFTSILSYPDIRHALLNQEILDIGLRKMSIQCYPHHRPHLPARPGCCDLRCSRIFTEICVRHTAETATLL